MLNNSGNGHGTSWPVEGLSVQGYAGQPLDPQTAYDQAAPHVVALRALAYVAYVNGASYPSEAAYLKVAEDGYALGQREERKDRETREKFSKRVQPTFHSLLEDFFVALAENGFEAPKKMTFSPEGLGRINEAFGYSPTGYNRTNSITASGTVELDSTARKNSCTCS